MFKKNLLALLILYAGFAKAQSPCDTVNLPVAANWTSNSYASLTAFPGVINGYISGVNTDHYIQQANYFNLSATSYGFLLGTAVKFTVANSSSADSLSKMLYVRVFADNNGVPGTEITTPQTIAQIPLSKVKADVANGALTSITFPSAITLPASKIFYVSVDMSNFQWNPSEGIRDSICISTTGDNETVNAAWNFDADVQKWKAYKKSWGAPPDESEPLDATLYIFPYASLTATGGCNGILPVTLLSFTAIQNNRDVNLRWQVTDETNIKGYELEKAGSNGIFSSLQYTIASNNLKNQTYSVTDLNAFVSSSSLQYRLKQIHIDGKFDYSKVIFLQSDASGIVFQNPFNNVLKLSINLTTTQSVSATICDMYGKTIAAQRPAFYYSGINTISFGETASLKAGIYLLKVTVNNNQFTYKIIKQY